MCVFAYIFVHVCTCVRSFIFCASVCSLIFLCVHVCFCLYLPVRASEQGIVIGLVSVYIYVIKKKCN